MRIQCSVKNQHFGILLKESVLLIELLNYFENYQKIVRKDNVETISKLLAQILHLFQFLIDDVYSLIKLLYPFNHQ
jgi:hypothetical protein